MGGLRRRIALTALLASGTALLMVFLVVDPALRREARQHIAESLLAEAHLAARIVEAPLARGAGSEELDPLVDGLARDLRARVTIIAEGGRVLADSAESGPELAAMENHWERPEVQAARATGSGVSERRSATVGEDFLYAAVPVRHAGALVGVSRVALSLQGVKAQARDFRRAVATALLVAFALTALVSTALSSALTGPLAEIMGAARSFAAGRLDARIGVLRSDELGELAQILNRAADQVQERLAETARERARNEAVLSAMAEGVLAVDHRGSVVLANQALRQVLQLERPVGRHYIEAIRQREVGEVIEEVLRGGERCEREVEVLRVGRVYALTGLPFPGAEEPGGVVLTFHEVTERRRLEQVRRDFVANASHELRTPLTSIRGFVEALEDGALHEPETAARFLGKIRTHADRMAVLIEDLLELSRLESAASAARREPIAPGALAAEVAASFAEKAEKRGTRVECLDRGAPSVLGDPERLRRILENLIDNAIKYTPPGGQVSVIASGDRDGGALIQVEDDGPGIPREHLPRIFERFYRVDRARSRELGGTGLGLSIVKHLAESLGASVSVTSEVGQGSCFSVRLPPEREAPGA